MNTKNVARRMASKVQRTLVSALILMVLFSTFPTGKASAWAYDSWSLRPGAVSAPAINVSNLRLGDGNIYLTLLSNTGAVAYRSPASTGAQNVAAVYTVQKWNGASWVNVTKKGPFIGQISATQSYLVFNPVYITLSPTNGYMRIVWSFVWSTTTGVQLGGTNLVSNLANDYVCLRPRCFSYTGYFQVW
jgi:hypothetical protein